MNRSLQRLQRSLLIYHSRGFYTNLVLLKASDKIPLKPVWRHVDDSELPPATKVSQSLAKHLEQLSLVNFENTNAIKRLESAIRFADQLLLVNTEGVEPMDSVLESESLQLREDIPCETDPKIVTLAKEVFEDYYIAPAGNIPYNDDVIPGDQDIENSKHS